MLFLSLRSFIVVLRIRNMLQARWCCCPHLGCTFYVTYVCYKVCSTYVCYKVCTTYIMSIVVCNCYYYVHAIVFSTMVLLSSPGREEKRVWFMCVMCVIVMLCVLFIV